MKHNNIKIVYLVVGEILNAPLLRRQIIELMGEEKNLDSSLSITLLNVLPIHTYLNHLKDTNEARQLLKQYGIGLTVLPTLVPCPLPNIGLMKTDKGFRPNMRWNRYATRMLGITLLPVLTYYLFIRRVRVFHCRSYPATYAVTFARKLLSSIRIIFDPRSDFPEENVTAGNWTANSKNYYFWKKVERNMLEKSSAVACIYPSQLKQYQQNFSGFNGFLVPNNVDCQKFKRDELIRARLRQQLGIAENEVVMCYLGDIGSGDWHRADIYIKAYQLMSKAHENIRFLFLVPGTGACVLRDEFNAIKAKDVLIVSPKYVDVANHLSCADYGLMFLHKQKNAVGTKVGEYLAAGLPVISNRNCLGAVELINQHQVGYVINIGVGDLDENEDLSAIKKLKGNEELKQWSEQVTMFSETYFDNKMIANQYCQQYQKLQS